MMVTAVYTRTFCASLDWAGMVARPAVKLVPSTPICPRLAHTAICVA